MAINPFDAIRQALQYLLDCEGDGWQLSHWVAAVGLQKIDNDGTIANTAWVVAPIGQAEYISDGLLAAAEEMRACADINDDDD